MFVIMDGLERTHLGEFKQYIKQKRVVYLDRTFSIWELLYISSKSVIYIGSDLGISHLLQMPTNAVLFFATGVPWVWRPYSKKQYNRIRKGNMIIEETTNSKNLKKKVIYIETWCRPCFDIGCKNIKCIKGLERNKQQIVQEIEEAMH
jgi:hypothetical protein